MGDVDDCSDDTSWDCWLVVVSVSCHPASAPVCRVLL